MAEQKLEHSEYSYGQIISGPADERPEDPSRWHEPTVSRAAVEKRYGLPVEELRRRSKFPKSHREGFRPRFTSWGADRIEDWRESDLLAWEEWIIGMADMLPKRR